MDPPGKTDAIRVFNGNNIEVIGSVMLETLRKHKVYTFKFFVVKEDVQTIIGCQDSLRYGFLKILDEDKMPSIHSLDASELVDITEYDCLFKGKGTLGNQYKIIIDEDII